MCMKIIKENKEITYVISKSKFIGIIRRVDTLDEIKKILDDLKNKHPLATHICYAYILDENKKYSDDKEPIGTAGKPILDILEKNNLNHCLAVVVRYFGGIKLGASGLLRSYTKAVKDTLENNIKDLENGYQIKIIEDYSKTDIIDYLLKDAVIIKKDYQEKIIIYAIIKKEILEKLTNIHFEIMEEVIF